MATSFPPELNQRYAREINRQLALAIQAAPFSAFAYLLRWEVDPLNTTESHGLLAHARVPSAGKVPGVRVRRETYGALGAPQQSLSGQVLGIANANAPDVAFTMFHEAAHTFVDELTSWNPSGPFEVLDAYCRAAGLPDGSYGGLGLAIQNNHPKLLQLVSNYGASEMKDRWKISDRSSLRPGSSPWPERYSRFHGFDAFAGDPASDAARSRWERHSAFEQRMIARLLFCLNEATTDATAEWLLTPPALQSTLSKELGAAFRALPDALTDGRDRRSVTLKYWAERVIHPSQLPDLVVLDETLAVLAAEQRGLSAPAIPYMPRSMDPSSLYLESTDAGGTLALRRAVSDPTLNPVHLFPQPGIEVFTPLLTGDARGAGEPYWLFEFGSGGELSVARREVDGVAVEPIIPVSGVDALYGLRVRSTAEIELDPMDTQFATFSSAYLSATLIANALGQASHLTPQQVTCLVPDLDSAPSRRYFVSERAVLARVQSSVVPGTETAEHAYWATFLDVSLIPLNGDEHLVSTTMRTPHGVHFIDSRLASSDALENATKEAFLTATEHAIDLTTRNTTAAHRDQLFRVYAKAQSEALSSLHDGYCSLPLLPLATFSRSVNLEVPRLGPLSVMPDRREVEAVRSVVERAVLRHVKVAVMDAAGDFLDEYLSAAESRSLDEVDSLHPATGDETPRLAGLLESTGTAAWGQIREMVSGLQPQLRTEIADTAKAWLREIVGNAGGIVTCAGELAECMKSGPSPETEARAEVLVEQARAFLFGTGEVDDALVYLSKEQALDEVRMLTALPGLATIGEMPPLPSAAGNRITNTPASSPKTPPSPSFAAVASGAPAQNGASTAPFTPTTARRSKGGPSLGM